jgi:hypothetical protein
LSLEGPRFNLEVKPTSDLHPHERTIPSHVEKMARELMNDGVQKDPIMVDQVSGSVLDGMHRLEAFKKLEVKKAVCCLVDYQSGSVTLSRWARVFVSKEGGDVGPFLMGLGFTRPVSFEDALLELDERRASAASFLEGRAFVNGRGTDLPQAFSAVSQIDAYAERRGWERRFVPEEDVKAESEMHDRFAVIVRRLSKDEIVQAAETGTLFPCKTTMHSFDPRPVAVNYPLDKLTELGAKRIEEHLAKSERRLLPAGTFYEGRRYKERLILLNPK